MPRPPRLSLRSNLAPILSGLALAVVALTDLLSSVIASFWSDHSMLTNIVASLLLVLVGATILDKWIKREDTRKLRVIEATAYDAVARPLLEQWRTLWYLLNAGRRLSEPGYEVPEGEKEDLLRILHRHGLEEVRHSGVSRGYADNPSDMERIKVLVTDEDWRELVYVVIRRTVDGSRQIIARWTQLLVTSKRSSEVLQQLSGCVNDLQAIRVDMLPWRYDGRELSAETVERFATLWRVAYANSLVVSAQVEANGATPWLVDWTRIFRLLQDSDRDALSVAEISDGRIERPYADDREPSIAGLADDVSPTPGSSP